MQNDNTERLQHALQRIVADDELHCRWLNTLSMMENVGAHKIVKGEATRGVTETVLQHAAEETRHAFVLKRQIRKLIPDYCPTYAAEFLINARKSFRYIHRIDAGISRLLQDELGLSGTKLRYYAYVLVTYVVEVRADEMYKTYQRCLKQIGSPVTVAAILAEEEQHLTEMNAEIERLFDDADKWRRDVADIESGIYAAWLDGLSELMDVHDKVA